MIVEFRPVDWMVRCRVPLLAVAWLLLGPSPSRAEDPPLGQSDLAFTNWTAAAYSHRAAGTVCWLAAPDGSLRVEARRGPAGFGEDHHPPPGGFPPDLEPLLTRTGDGWTVVLGPDDTGTLNAWDREWRRPPTGLVQLIRLITGSLRSYPGPEPKFGFAAKLEAAALSGGITRPKVLAGTEVIAKDGDTWRYQLASLDLAESPGRPAAGFRSAMTARGRGTGGEGELVTLSWFREDGWPGYGVRVHSSRRPGTLILEYPRRLAVPTPEPEIFLPLWPMSQFIHTR